MAHSLYGIVWDYRYWPIYPSPLDLGLIPPVPVPRQVTFIFHVSTAVLGLKRCSSVRMRSSRNLAFTLLTKLSSSCAAAAPSSPITRLHR
ncbi:hypothetical protein H2248_011612 [Termitomyces sp. 'cryptogamus']|nr:hypothetical protein H2248_011612 [Termitomyces sp. 'cryptogamus']